MSTLAISQCGDLKTRSWKCTSMKPQSIQNRYAYPLFGVLNRKNKKHMTRFDMSEKIWSLCQGALWTERRKFTLLNVSLGRSWRFSQTLGMERIFRNWWLFRFSRPCLPLQLGQHNRRTYMERDFLPALFDLPEGLHGLLYNLYQTADTIPFI